MHPIIHGNASRQHKWRHNYNTYTDHTRVYSSKTLPLLEYCTYYFCNRYCHEVSKNAAKAAMLSSIMLGVEATFLTQVTTNDTSFPSLPFEILHFCDTEYPDFKTRIVPEKGGYLHDLIWIPPETDEDNDDWLKGCPFTNSTVFDFQVKDCGFHLNDDVRFYLTDLVDKFIDDNGFKWLNACITNSNNAAKVHSVT